MDLLFHSFNTYVLSAYHILGSLLGVGNKTDKDPYLHEAYILIIEERYKQ